MPSTGWAGGYSLPSGREGVYFSPLNIKAGVTGEHLSAVKLWAVPQFLRVSVSSPVKWA